MTDVDTARVQFVIGGVQKGGTTAMAHCLSQHPGVQLPLTKEAHVFDAPDFEDTRARDDIDRYYADKFAASEAPCVRGDATPIYCLHERFVERIARYNPAMRWILLLRHPVERAISQYHMERARGDETWPLLPALLCERWRLRGHADDFSVHSPLRKHSYRLRGDYARQIDTVLRHFPREQVLLLRSADFLRVPQDVLEQVYIHLELPGAVRMPQRTQVFAGNYAMPSPHSMVWRIAQHLLREQMRAMRERYGIDFE